MNTLIYICENLTFSERKIGTKAEQSDNHISYADLQLFTVLIQIHLKMGSFELKKG